MYTFQAQLPLGRFDKFVVKVAIMFHRQTPNNRFIMPAVKPSVDSPASPGSNQEPPSECFLLRVCLLQINSPIC